jgi:DnaJ-class molecular chaperone
MKKPVVRPIEHKCPECNGTGLAVVSQPGRPGIRIYPARCKKCLGKGRIAN